MRLNTKRMAVTGFTAAIYAALTVFLPIPAYGAVQCRLSEVLNLLVFINPAFAPGIILGCFISNLFSSVNPLLDCIVGTGATAITMLFITKFSRNLFVASLWPTVFCVFIGGLILFTSGMPWTFVNFVTLTLTVMVGEFIAMTVIGYPLFKILMRNSRFMAYMKGI